jgi:hypothetical protein
VLAQTGPVLTLERAQFLNATLKCSSINLTLTLQLNHLGASRGDHVFSFNLGASGVLIGRALCQRKHGHGLLADILDGRWSGRWRGRGCNRCGSRRLHWRGSRTGCTLLCGCQAATKLSILALKCTEFEFDLIEEGINLVHLVPALALSGRELLISYVLGGQGHLNHTLSLTDRWEVTLS